MYDTWPSSGRVPRRESRPADDLDVALFNTLRATLSPPLPDPLTVEPTPVANSSIVRRPGGQGASFVSTTKPGVTRGEHFHLRKIERFVVLRGRARIALRKLFSNDVVAFDVDGDKPAIVDMPTMWVHNITNTGSNELLTLFWTHRVFDPQAPDTYAERVSWVLPRDRVASCLGEPPDARRAAIQLLPGFFLSQLGPWFLAVFYRGFVDAPDALTVTARAPGRGALLAVAIGTTHPVGFNRRLVKRRAAELRGGRSILGRPSPVDLAPAGAGIALRGGVPVPVPVSGALLVPSAFLPLRARGLAPRCWSSGCKESLPLGWVRRA